MMASSFDGAVIEQLVNMGYTKQQCINASKLVSNCHDINEVQDKLMQIEDIEMKKDYEMDQQKQLDPCKVWKCEQCSTLNILYNTVCKSCKAHCNIVEQIELKIKQMIKMM